MAWSPHSSTMPETSRLFASMFWPCLGKEPHATSSPPVGMKATCGRANTLTCAYPPTAAPATLSGVRSVWAGAMRSPCLVSGPEGFTLSPGFMRCRRREPGSMAG